MKFFRLWCELHESHNHCIRVHFITSSHGDSHFGHFVTELMLFKGGNGEVSCSYAPVAPSTYIVMYLGVTVCRETRF